MLVGQGVLMTGGSNQGIKEGNTPGVSKWLYLPIFTCTGVEGEGLTEQNMEEYWVGCASAEMMQEAKRQCVMTEIAG